MIETKSNRFVLEVRRGVILYLNETADVDDGWWWGSDTDALQNGPFASSADALADARQGGEFKVMHMNHKKFVELDDLPADGHVIVVDTAGALLVRTGERPATAGWSPPN